MKAVIIISVVLSLTLCASAQDVRKLTWGMSREKVKQLEGVQSFQSGKSNDGFDYIYYSGKINNLDCVLTFYFIKGQLFIVRYLFIESHSENNLFRDDFLGVALILDNKYGDAKVEKIWTNDLYKDDMEDWGTAIAAGHLTMYTERDLERTKITHILSGDNFKINHEVSFKSKELATAADEERKKKAASDF